MEEVPEEFLCPISLEIMLDPVICIDGHSYERSMIANLPTSISPITREPIDKTKLIPNRNLKVAIEKFNLKRIKSEALEKRISFLEEALEKRILILEAELESLKKPANVPEQKHYSKTHPSAALTAMARNVSVSLSCPRPRRPEEKITKLDIMKGGFTQKGEKDIQNGMYVEYAKRYDLQFIVEPNGHIEIIQWNNYTDGIMRGTQKIFHYTNDIPISVYNLTQLRKMIECVRIVDDWLFIRYFVEALQNF